MLETARQSSQSDLVLPARIERNREANPLEGLAEIKAYVRPYALVALCALTGCKSASTASHPAGGRENVLSQSGQRTVTPRSKSTLESVYAAKRLVDGIQEKCSAGKFTVAERSKAARKAEVLEGEFRHWKARAQVSSKISSTIDEVAKDLASLRRALNAGDSANYEDLPPRELAKVDGSVQSCYNLIIALREEDEARRKLARLAQRKLSLPGDRAVGYSRRAFYESPPNQRDYPSITRVYEPAQPLYYDYSKYQHGPLPWADQRAYYEAQRQRESAAAGQRVSAQDVADGIGLVADVLSIARLFMW